MEEGRPARAWDRYSWVAGVVFVIALATEAVISVGFKVNQDDSAAKIATSIDDHHKRLVLVMCLCVIYAAAFPIFLTGLHDLLRASANRSRRLTSLVLVGGIAMIALHATSDVGIYGVLAKIGSFSAQHDQGLAYTLYLLTFGLDSVGDIFGSLFAVAAGVLVLQSRVLPRWLGWIAIVFGVCFFIQAFGLGGVVAKFGLVVDGIGFVLFLFFVLASSVILLARPQRVVEH
jgi:hypothetical protein